MRFRICKTCFEFGYNSGTGYQFWTFWGNKIDVAQALYQATVKFDETKPTCVKVVQLVNLD